MNESRIILNGSPAVLFSSLTPEQKQQLEQTFAQQTAEIIAAYFRLHPELLNELSKI